MGAMTVDRHADGLWRWTARHPAWRDGEEWEPDVACTYLETADAVVLFDPLVPGGDDRDRFWHALDRDVARLQRPVEVLLTCAWHRRSADMISRRYGARVRSPAPNTANRIADGDVIAGVRAIGTGMPSPQDELVYWVDDHRTLVCGDILLGDAAGGLRVAPASWYDRTPVERDWYRSGIPKMLSSLAGLGPALVIPAHGRPCTTEPAAAIRKAAAAIAGA